MKCPNIPTVRFSGSSKAAIKRIKRMRRVANVLASVLAGSVLLEIFTGNGALGSANNIKKKDWETWAKAMRAVPNMAKKSINDIVQLQLIEGSLTISERKFWEAVAYGCR